MSIQEEVRQARAKVVLFLPHAIKAMSRSTPTISTAEVDDVLAKGEVIEDYPEDVRGHSCLLFGAVDFRKRRV